jgi:hypothetical protein
MLKVTIPREVPASYIVLVRDYLRFAIAGTSFGNYLCSATLLSSYVRRIVTEGGKSYFRNSLKLVA